MIQSRRKLLLIAILSSLMITIFLFNCSLIVAQNVDIFHSDFFTFWLGGKLALHKQNLYDPHIWSSAHTINGAKWIFNPVFIFPIASSIFFMPLGVLPLWLAYPLWITLSSVLTIASLLLLLSFWKTEDHLIYILPVLAGFPIFRPVIVSMRNGQLGPFILFVLVLSLFMNGKLKGFLAGLLLSLALIKPTIGLPIVGMVYFWLIIRSKWNIFAGLTLGIAIYLVLSFSLSANWLSDFLQIGGNKLVNNAGISPTIWGIIRNICDNQITCLFNTSSIISLVSILFFLVEIYINREKIEYFDMLSFSIILTTLFSPYFSVYDQILLIIPIMGAMYYIRLQYPQVFLLNAIIPVSISAFSISLLLLATYRGQDEFSILIPLVVSVLYLYFMCRAKHLVRDSRIAIAK